MIRPFKAILIITFLALLTGCISGPPLQTTVITSPSKRLEIYWVRTYQDKKGVLVTGTVHRPVLAKGALWGHLHIEGLFDDRRPPITVDTRWGTLSPRGSRSAPFRAVLPTSTPRAIKSIRIEYRAERDLARKLHLD